jgi:hypothetical protein
MVAKEIYLAMRTNLDRIHYLIENAIHKFVLDLKGLHILTEAATGYYILTPVIAALAGADQVYAITCNSRYGTASAVCDEMIHLARYWGMENRIRVFESREDPCIQKADIITNLGFVRPLDAPFLRRLKPKAVIPLMWESWEYRAEDLDLEECRHLGIPVLGTNEHHPDLRIFEYLGPLALKLLLAMDVEVYNSNIVIIGSGEFADIIKKYLLSVKANVTPLNPQNSCIFEEKISHEALKLADAIVVAEHHSRGMLIGPEGRMSSEILHALNPHLVIVHICGGVDRMALESAGIRCVPNEFAPPGHMSVTTDYLGPRPLIDLHTAGLKVGELLWRRNQELKDSRKVEQILAEECSLCQCLPEILSNKGCSE